ncbi:REP-associated tyrosine transposase [Neisseria meningitidis]|uniref:REP-associated tyrosine transposase n=1 Tax=Neisseria meningitidis TaxID=487 RepID=UPI001E4D8806|nr:transposase [Neisseria meningitidis]
MSNVSASRAAYMDVQKQYSFETVAVSVLPNHIHAIWTLPPDDADYSLLRRLIKTKFSAHFPHAQNLSASKQRRHERGIWHRRFYEHTVRDETDLRRCANHIRSNPIKQKMSRAETETGTILQKIISVFSNAILIHSQTSNKACAT